MGNHFSFHLAKRKLGINFSFPNFHHYQLRVAFIPLTPVYLPAGLSYEKRTRVLVLSQPAQCICFAGFFLFFFFFTMVHSQALCIVHRLQYLNSLWLTSALLQGASLLTEPIQPHHEARNGILEPSAGPTPRGTGTQP